MKNETIFRQYHDDTQSFFSKETKLTFGQCDMNNRMTFQELLLLTSDTAVEDYNQKGLAFDYLVNNGFSILTSRQSFHILKMPVSNQKITVKTWEEKPAGLQLSRKYEIRDSLTDEVLVSGSSFWTVVDFKLRKIIPPKNFKLRKEPDFTTDYDGIAPGKIKVPENLKEIGFHKIVFSDMDANGHTNNSKYANFAMDCLPEQYQNKIVKDFRINYSKEALLGEEIKLYASFENENMICVVGKNQNETCFECEFYY